MTPGKCSPGKPSAVLPNSDGEKWLQHCMALTDHTKHSGLKPDAEASLLDSTFMQPELLCSRVWALLPVPFNIAVNLKYCPFFQPFCDVTPLLPRPTLIQEPEIIRYRERVCISPQHLSCWHRERASIPVGTRKYQEELSVPEGQSSNMGPSYKLKNSKLQNFSK